MDSWSLQSVLGFFLHTICILENDNLSLHVWLSAPLVVFVVARPLSSLGGAAGVICNHFKNALEVNLTECSFILQANI